MDKQKCIKALLDNLYEVYLQDIIQSAIFVVIVSDVSDREELL